MVTLIVALTANPCDFLARARSWGTLYSSSSWALASPLAGPDYVLVASDTVSWASASAPERQGGSLRLLWVVRCAAHRAATASTGSCSPCLVPQGAVVWSQPSALPLAAAVSSSCAVSLDGSYVVVGGHDFAVHALLAKTGTAACVLATGAAVSSGVALTNWQRRQ
jgi:hypothetical protein